MKQAIAISGLWKSYGEHAVLKGLDLCIAAGECFALLGVNGAGKTTTALSIMRLLPATTGRIINGEIVFEGENLLEIDEERMRKIRGEKIAMVFQDPMTSLNPVQTVGEQIAEGIRLHNENMPKEDVEKRVEEILSLVGIIPKRKYDYPHQFSGGMKQRVVIAIALSCEPDLL